MKVFRVGEDGSSIAAPRPFSKERRFAFLHPEGESRSIEAYCLRLSKRWLRLGDGHNWKKMEYGLLASAQQFDDLGNPIYVLKRSYREDGTCLCLLDMRPGNDIAIFHEWNDKVTVLGKGIEMRTVRSGKNAARRALEIEYPVLLCLPGAEFGWTKCGFGNHHYQAEWDGHAINVTTPPFFLTELGEQLALAAQDKRRQALRRKD